MCEYFLAIFVQAIDVISEKPWLIPLLDDPNPCISFWLTTACWQVVIKGLLDRNIILSIPSWLPHLLAYYGICVNTGSDIFMHDAEAAQMCEQIQSKQRAIKKVNTTSNHHVGLGSEITHIASFVYQRNCMKYSAAVDLFGLVHSTSSVKILPHPSTLNVAAQAIPFPMIVQHS